MPAHLDEVLSDFTQRLRRLDEVTALWVAGSLAIGDHIANVSDLDLVAVTSRPLSAEAVRQVTEIHADLDAGAAHGMDLGCQYVAAPTLADRSVEHPTWTHGSLVDRQLSLVTRAELALHGFALLGPPPQELLPPVGADEVRAAARAELAGYWSYAARRPGMFHRLPVMVDLGLTSMARARHAIDTGTLLTKSQAIEVARAPGWLVDQMRSRRRGEQVRSAPWRAAAIAWWDVRRTTWGVDDNEQVTDVP